MLQYCISVDIDTENNGEWLTENAGRCLLLIRSANSFGIYDKKRIYRNFRMGAAGFRGSFLFFSGGEQVRGAGVSSLLKG